MDERDEKTVVVWWSDGCYDGYYDYDTVIEANAFIRGFNVRTSYHYVAESSSLDQLRRYAEVEPKKYRSILNDYLADRG